MESDRDIMLQVQNGRTGAFARLVSRYQDRLTRFAVSKLRDHQLAEDLVQETFLAAYRARASYSPEFAFTTWIWTILLNLSRRTHRRQAQHAAQLVAYARENPLWTSADSDQLEQLISSEQQARVHIWLDQIPEDEADALRLRFLGGLKFEEIALAMDSSVSGAKVRVKRGLLRLATMLRVDE